MKGKINAKKTPRREWGYDRRVCNYHTGRSWICWTACEHIEIRRSEADAFRDGERSFDSAGAKLVSESGAVTAEFAAVIPVVILVLSMVLSLTSLQTQRYQLIELAAMSARSIARGESVATASLLAREMNVDVFLKVEHENHLVCVSAEKESRVFWLGRLPLVERQCARKNGL